MGQTVVTQDHITTWHKNPISGYEWMTIRLIKRWSLLGGVASNKIKFKSPEAAQDHADFLNKWFGPEYIKYIQGVKAK